jgi:hypothetical protein
MKTMSLFFVFLFLSCDGVDQSNSKSIRKITNEIKSLYEFNFDTNLNKSDGYYLISLPNEEKGYSYLFKINIKNEILQAIIIQGNAYLSEYIDNDIFLAIGGHDVNLNKDALGFEHSKFLILDEDLSIKKIIGSPYDMINLKSLDFHAITKYKNNIVKSYFIKDNNDYEKKPFNKNKVFLSSLISYTVGNTLYHIDLKNYDSFSYDIYRNVSMPFNNIDSIKFINEKKFPFIDYHHVNSINISKDIMYISARNTSAIYMYDIKNDKYLGKIVGDKSFGKSDYSYKGSSFSQQNSAFINSRDNLVLFNNNSKKGDMNSLSELLEIKIDHKNKKAKEVFSFKIKQKQSSITGNIQELSSKDYIISTGKEDFDSTETDRSHIIRIDRSGKIITKINIKYKDFLNRRNNSPLLYKSFFIEN